MHTRLIPLVLTTALLLSLGVFAGCGDDDEDGNGGGNGAELTLDEYFDEYLRLKTDTEAKSDDAEAKLDEEPASAEEAADLFGEAIAEFVDIAKDARDGLNGLNPPSEVADLHSDFISVWEEGIDALEALESDIEGLDSPEDLLDLLPQIEEDFGSLDGNTEQVCLDLQAVADENDIDVDLECGEDEEE